MTSPLRRAAALAFERTLQELEMSGAEPEFEDPAELGRRGALLAAADAVWRGRVGPLLDGAQVRDLLGVGSRQAVSDLVRRRRLLALPTAQGAFLFPAFQFTHGGRPHPALARILDVFAEVEINPHTIASWFTTPQAALAKQTPAEWLKAGRDPEAVREAARRTAARLG